MHKRTKPHHTWHTHNARHGVIGHVPTPGGIAGVDQCAGQRGGEPRLAADRTALPILEDPSRNTGVGARAVGDMRRAQSRREVERQRAVWVICLYVFVRYVFVCACACACACVCGPVRVCGRYGLMQGLASLPILEDPPATLALGSEPLLTCRGLRV